MTDLSHDTFSPDELMPLVPSLFIASSFLQTAFFGEVFEFDTAEVHFDRVLDDMRPAPYVSQLAPGSVQAPRGYRKETIIPAGLKPKSPITGKEVLQRLPGEAIGGEMSASDRAAAIRASYLDKHMERITRQREIQASSILRTGAVTIAGPEYPTSLVDFSRTGTLTKALLTTARWGEAGVSPYDDIDGWMNEVGEAAGSAVDIVVMDRKAWALYAADPKVEKALDKNLGQTAAITLGFTPGVPGAPQYKGRDGGVEFYVYNNIDQDESFNATQLIPDYTVMMASRAGYAGAKLCGLVQHAENNFAQGEYFAHEWIDPNTGAQWVETITAPILAPKRVNASLCATVR